jgi:SSS family transporter
MRPLDWLVLVLTLGSIVGYGLYRARASRSVSQYLLAGKTMPWYAIALSIMATQAGAITFISTTGQAYVDGMRFVQYYFGLPLAMVILSATAVPIFHQANVFTAYEYLEQRFDPKTRALASIIFLIQRGLGVGIALAAPAIVLSLLFGWSDNATILIMGAVTISYTVAGGVKAIAWADVQQMIIIFCGLLVALGVLIYLLPSEVSFGDALYLAGKAGKLNAVVPRFDLNDRYTLWSGLIGGMFLALSYFGCDQSQVQRYLTGRSIAQSKLSLLFNAAAKIPMQFFILFTGAMVFVFYTFVQPPLVFKPDALAQMRTNPAFPEIERRFGQAFEKRRQAAQAMIAARRQGDEGAQNHQVDAYREAQREIDAVRKQGAALVDEKLNDTNYIFLSFVTSYVPPGVVGLVLAVIFGAAMSAISGEINSLATVSVIDIYRRHLRPESGDAHYLKASRWATAFWGIYAMWFATYGRNLGSLVEAVNMVGSLFYGSLLGVFTLAFFFKRVDGRGAFWGMLAGEAAIFAAFGFTGISFLWYNVIGAVVVVGTGLLISGAGSPGKSEPALDPR